MVDMSCATIIRKIIGISLTIVGTFLLAISVKSETQYTGDKYMEDIVERSRKDGGFIPTYTYINKKLFRIGLACIAVGAILQW
jgi:hypothetical protein